MFKKYAKSTLICPQSPKVRNPGTLQDDQGGGPCASLMYELKNSAERTRSETYYQKGGRAASSTSVPHHRAPTRDLVATRSLFLHLQA